MPYNVPRYTGIFAHAGLQRARESAHAAAARRAAKLLEAQGRSGDRHLVHVDDDELEAIRHNFGPGGGEGRPNPVTGLESFAPEDDSGNEDLAAIHDAAVAAGIDSLRRIAPASLSPPYGSAATSIDSGQPSGTDLAPPDSYQLAQSFLPLFARPPWVPPNIIRPLEELPRGSSGGPGAGKPFRNSQRPEPGTPCTYCTDRTTEEPGPKKLHRDHIVPQSRGGNNSDENLGPACETCNLHKGARTPEEWYRAMGIKEENGLEAPEDQND